VFSVGAREFLLDGDVSYSIPGNVPVVRKSTGELIWMPSPQIALDDNLREHPNPNPTLRV
jgi:hypothetical protein